MSDKPSWEVYFLTMAYIVSRRSIDPRTKCGCVVVDEANSVLSTGYNSPPRGTRDDLIPLSAPEKYDFMWHSEHNAILNAARVGNRLEGSTFYITGPPCDKCLGDMINVGARRIVYGNNNALMVNKEVEKRKKLLMKGRRFPELIQIRVNIETVLKDTLEYVKTREDV